MKLRGMALNSLELAVRAHRHTSGTVKHCCAFPRLMLRSVDLRLIRYDMRYTGNASNTLTL
jgi:hypothetical protein